MRAAQRFCTNPLIESRSCEPIKHRPRIFMGNSARSLLRITPSGAARTLRLFAERNPRALLDAA